MITNKKDNSKFPLKTFQRSYEGNIIRLAYLMLAIGFQIITKTLMSITVVTNAPFTFQLTIVTVQVNLRSSLAVFRLHYSAGILFFVLVDFKVFFL